MILIVMLGVHQVESRINKEIKNKKMVAKEVKICNNIIEAEISLNPEYIIMKATAYTKSKSEGTYKGITKSGTQVSRGSVAVDPRRIPLGTKLYIEGYGHAVACDTGGDIKHDRIDLYMETKKEAFEFGRRDVKVYIMTN